MTTFANDTVKTFTIKKFSTRKAMGEVSAADVCAKVVELLETKETINMIFAAAPSQLDFMDSFRNDPNIDFPRINAFHLDEYIGLPPNAPQSFGNFLNANLFSGISFRSVNYINGNADDPEAECARYAKLLEEYPPDIICLGIGENGHIAFNDPHVADFQDSKLVKIVELDMMCRQQQVNDECFDILDDVPTHAITLTIPALIEANHHFCMVPAEQKANAIYNTIYGPINEECPASILRICNNVILYVDSGSGKLL